MHDLAGWFFPMKRRGVCKTVFREGSSLYGSFFGARKGALGEGVSLILAAALLMMLLSAMAFVAFAVSLALFFWRSGRRSSFFVIFALISIVPAQVIQRTHHWEPLSGVYGDPAPAGADDEARRRSE